MGKVVDLFGRGEDAAIDQALAVGNDLSEDDQVMAWLDRYFAPVMPVAEELSNPVDLAHLRAVVLKVKAMVSVWPVP